MAEMSILKENSIGEEEVLLKMIEQSFRGVMFHTFETDLFLLLNLKGFHSLHKRQVLEERESFIKLKECYVNKYNALPQFKNNDITFWKDNENLKRPFSEEDTSRIVKESFEQYSQWEYGVLNNLIQWKKYFEEKTWVQTLIDEVLKEIKKIDTMMDILNEHDFKIECIQEMSNFLYKKLGV